MSDNCIICGTEAKLKCGGCKNVAYCGVEHQKKDWKNHKLICSSKLYEVRHMVILPYVEKCRKKLIYTFKIFYSTIHT